MDGVMLTSLHSAFVRRTRTLGLDLASLLPHLAAHPSIQHVTNIPEELCRLFVTAHDVSPEHPVHMQAVFQRYSESGVSKTINAPGRSHQTRGRRGLSPHTSALMQGPHRLSNGQPGTTSLAAPHIPVEPRRSVRAITQQN